MLQRAALRLMLLLCVATSAIAQTPHPPINSPIFRAFDANGNPLAGGKLYTYAAGSSTPQTTYSTADTFSSSPNANPVILDSTGSAKIFLDALDYKFILEDANGTLQWTVDNISGAPAPSDVTSVFGRIGAVVAVTGDYSCAQVTGAVCAIPTVYYQTVNAGGTDLPQEQKLKFVDGTNFNTRCIDNASSHSTDCTLNATTSLPAAVCSGSSCYRLWPDGSIDQWGTITGCATSNNTCDTSIIFPHAFTSTSFLAIIASCENWGTCVTTVGGKSTTGFTATQAPSVIVGGSGANLPGSQIIDWSAHGN